MKNLGLTLTLWQFQVANLLLPVEVEERGCSWELSLVPEQEGPGESWRSLWWPDLLLSSLGCSSTNLHGLRWPSPSPWCQSREGSEVTLLHCLIPSSSHGSQRCLALWRRWVGGEVPSNNQNYSPKSPLQLARPHPHPVSLCFSRSRPAPAGVWRLLVNSRAAHNPELEYQVMWLLPPYVHLLCCAVLNHSAAAAAKSLESCPTLCDPTDGSPPGSAVPGILQARTLEWVAISFSNAWKWKVKVKSLSRGRLLATPWTAAHQVPPSMGFSRQEYWSGVPLPSLA